MANWRTFDYSKSQVRKAAEKLVANNLSLEEKIEAVTVVANFRSAHSYPMQAMIGNIRNKAFQVDKNAIVVRRLKRIPSILSKLKRLPNMQITTMGDIGGIRVIVKELKQVKQLRDEFTKGRTKNILLKENDYIQTPKESGYRSIHHTYSYQGSKEEYKGFRVEVQLRSAVQHSWATAVEVAGAFLRQNMKAGQGNEQWLKFFQLTSPVFACLENNTVIDQSLKNRINTAIESLQVFDKLRSFVIISRHIQEKKEGFYLLRLDTQEKTVSVQHIPARLLLDAYEDYRRIEQETSEDVTKDVVLVSANSLKELKLAYPNYFADTQLFLSNLNRALGIKKR